ncbi:MAG: nucleotidyltransferase family protein [Leptolyngbya sp. SIOISBB]|nr:nucleotidyltransferase family protein [Leptolyngbya sp. SIOISBB]
MNSLPIDLAPDTIQHFCQKWQITELSLFGSVLRDDFHSDSDIDVLVTFAPDAPWTLLDLVNMEYELTDLTGRDIDLVEKQAIASSDNWLRRDEILDTAQVVYSDTYVSA